MFEIPMIWVDPYSARFRKRYAETFHTFAPLGIRNHAPKGVSLTRTCCHVFFTSNWCSPLPDARKIRWRTSPFVSRSECVGVQWICAMYECMDSAIMRN